MNPLSHGEREGPVRCANGKVRGYALAAWNALTPHPPTPDGAGPSFSLWEKG